MSKYSLGDAITFKDSEGETISGTVVQIDFLGIATLVRVDKIFPKEQYLTVIPHKRENNDE